MIHQRRAIRQAVAAVLQAAAIVPAAQVHDNPSAPRTVFPALVIEDDTEPQAAITRPAGVDRAIERRYRFSVAVEVRQAGTAYADTRDDLCAAVEAALAAASLPGVKAVVPVGWQASNSMSHEYPITVGQQSFEALYYTSQGNPSAAL